MDQRDGSLERALPNSAEAERALLGNILLDNSLVDEAITLLRPEDFYVPSSRRIFIAMLALHQAGSAIDPVLVGEELRKDSLLEAVGGISHVTNLTYGLPHAQSISHYAKIIKGKSALRQLVKAAGRITQTALEEEDDPDAIIDQAEQEIFRIAKVARPGPVTSFRSFLEISEDAAAVYEQMHRGISRAIPTGYPSLDRATGGGITPGDVWLVLAKSGDGKSSWALGAAKHQALNDIPAAFVSLEMSDFDNFRRIHAAMSGVAAWKIQPGIYPDEYDVLKDTLQATGTLPIWVNSQLRDILDLRSQARQLVSEHKVRSLYVDYVQLMDVALSRNNSTRAYEIATISRLLKELAMELSLGVVVLSQSDKEGVKSGKVKAIHARESTALMADASVVIVIDMPEERDNQTSWECAMRIDKHRNGPKMSLKYRYNGETLTFHEVREPGNNGRMEFP